MIFPRLLTHLKHHLSLSFLNFLSDFIVVLFALLFANALLFLVNEFLITRENISWLHSSAPLWTQHALDH